LVYYVTFAQSAAENGVWLYDLQNPAQPPRQLPFFGTYRWRDAQRLIYLPMEPDQSNHHFYEYDISSRQTRPLFPAGPALTIANNDWTISPDGQKIALVAAQGMALDGIWVLEIKANTAPMPATRPPLGPFFSEHYH